MAKLPPTKYELLLKASLSCFHCASEQKNMPKLKKHLQEEWEKLQTQAENQKKRKFKSEINRDQPSSCQGEATRKDDASPAYKKIKRASHEFYPVV